MTTQREHSPKTRPLAPDETNMSVTCKKEFASRVSKYSNKHGASRNQFARAALDWVIRNGGKYDHESGRIVFPDPNAKLPEYPAHMLTDIQRAVAERRATK